MKNFINTLSDEQADELAKLIAELLEVQLHAGKPSLRDIARKGSRVNSVSVSYSSISRVLRGQSELTLRFLTVFLAGCDVPQEEIKSIWKPKWIKFTESLRPITVSVSYPAEPAGGYECSRCGSWVVNPERHGAFHERLEGRRVLAVSR
jgi:hypothetical protein